VISKRVLIGENAVPGVIGAKAIHLQSPEERERVLGHKEL
jgi:endoglucanase